MSTFTGTFGGLGRPAGHSNGSQHGWMSGIFASVKRLRSRSALSTELGQLSDHQLADIGLTRADVPATFWGDFGALGRDGNR